LGILSNSIKKDWVDYNVGPEECIDLGKTARFKGFHRRFVLEVVLELGIMSIQYHPGMSQRWIRMQNFDVYGHAVFNTCVETGLMMDILNDCT
jgi:hypothetical protein